ncbi:helix-turn-helix domain-containing protein, partial [Acidiplasma cupricumulans]
LFKKSKIIKEILYISIVDRRKNLYEIAFKERYENMVSSVLYEHNALEHNDLINNNMEYITALIPGEDVKDLKNDLSDLGELESFTAKSKVCGDSKSLFSLTDQEALTIYTAYINDYFNIPRKKYLRELSEVTGLSKSTLEEYIRKATYKIIKDWIYQNEYFLIDKFGKRVIK